MEAACAWQWDADERQRSTEADSDSRAATPPDCPGPEATPGRTGLSDPLPSLPLLPAQLACIWPTTGGPASGPAERAGLSGGAAAAPSSALSSDDALEDEPNTSRSLRCFSAASMAAVCGL